MDKEGSGNPSADQAEFDQFVLGGSLLATFCHLQPFLVATFDKKNALMSAQPLTVCPRVWMLWSPGWVGLALRFILPGSLSKSLVGVLTVVPDVARRLSRGSPPHGRAELQWPSRPIQIP